VCTSAILLVIGAIGCAVCFSTNLGGLKGEGCASHVCLSLPVFRCLIHALLNAHLDLVAFYEFKMNKTSGSHLWGNMCASFYLRGQGNAECDWESHFWNCWGEGWTWCHLKKEGSEVLRSF
jgi:hypothetical protein